MAKVTFIPGSGTLADYLSGEIDHHAAQSIRREIDAQVADRLPELLTRDWYVDVDVSKYAAYFVVALNHDMSVSSIIDPIKKIEALLAKRG